MHTTAIMYGVEETPVSHHITNIKHFSIQFINIMKAILICIISMVVSSSLCAQTKTEKEIISILHSQDAAWNNGNIESFMQTYWVNDSLMFIGKSGIWLVEYIKQLQKRLSRHDVNGEVALRFNPN
jgi:recombinational DNA repair protein RecR